MSSWRSKAKGSNNPVVGRGRGDRQKNMEEFKEGLEMSEDPELSSSLLNMSLDKDMLLDEMGLSLSDKSILARPLDSGAMESLQRGAIGVGDGDASFNSHSTPQSTSRGSWGTRSKSKDSGSNGGGRGNR